MTQFLSITDMCNQLGVSTRLSPDETAIEIVQGGVVHLTLTPSNDPFENFDEVVDNALFRFCKEQMEYFSQNWNGL